MAGAADKKQAVSNTKILKEIHLSALIINLVAVISLFYFHRPVAKKWYILMNSAAWTCQYIIEKTGRPKYSDKDFQGRVTLLSTGDDLRQSGLTEYMFDIIYVTLICNILMVLFGSNKVWLIYLAIPAFAMYKFKGIIGMVLGMLGINLGRKNKSGGGEMGGDQDGTIAGANGEPSKSKRQTKLEARGNKQKVRYR